MTTPNIRAGNWGDWIFLTVLQGGTAHDLSGHTVKFELIGPYGLFRSRDPSSLGGSNSNIVGYKTAVDDIPKGAGGVWEVQVHYEDADEGKTTHSYPFTVDP